MIISVASGKGGTGKTTVAVNLALSLSGAQILDCDVEEPNAHLFIKPKMLTKRPVFIPVPTIDNEKCDYCRRCQEVCAYNAIAVVNNRTLVFPELCHGCGSCAYFCPRGAITEKNREIGFVEAGRRGDLEFTHGKLNIGQAMSPPLIKEVKKHIRQYRTAVIDAPPGTSCPVITAVNGSDFCILVTEPTPFGLNDLVLAVEVVRKLGISFGVVINRSDLGDDKTENYCLQEKIPVLMKISFKKEIASAYSKGEAIVDVFPAYREEFRSLAEKVERIAQKETGNTKA